PDRRRVRGSPHRLPLHLSQGASPPAGPGTGAVEMAARYAVSGPGPEGSDSRVMNRIGSTFDLEWRDRFERFARKHRDGACFSGWSEMGPRRRVQLFLSLLTSLNLPRRVDTLDLGCGAGTYVRRLAELGHNVVGMDYSWPTLMHAVSADAARRSRYLAADG